MSSILLPNSDLPTSRLGFGCAYTVGGFETKSSLKLIDTVLKAGYRHFDVAPIYGLGSAEIVLGQALRGIRSNVTLATKVGISPHRRLRKRTQLLRMVSTPLRRCIPSLTRSIGAQLYKPSFEAVDWSINMVDASLFESLHRLQTDYLDILFLHEAEVNNISDELIAHLQKRKRDGLIRAIGLGSEYYKAVDVMHRYPNVFDAIQYSWSVVDYDQPVIAEGTFRLSHRALARAFNVTRDFFRSRRTEGQKVSALLGLDLCQDVNLSRVLLGAAIWENKKGIVLVSSRNMSRVVENAALIDNENWVEAGAAFLNLVKSNGILVELREEFLRYK